MLVGRLGGARQVWAPGMGRNEAHDSAGMELDSDSMAFRDAKLLFFFFKKESRDHEGHSDNPRAPSRWEFCEWSHHWERKVTGITQSE